MAFRDETEALHARIEALEIELSEARERVEELERERADVAPLQARIAELEEALAKHAPAPRTTSRPNEQRTLRIVMGVVGALTLGGIGAFLALDDARPILDGDPMRGVVDLDATPLMPPSRGQADGDGEVGSGCPGYAPSNPYVVLRTTEPRRTRIWTESSGDLVLYVRTADGRVVCDDDSGDGMNASLVADLGPGDHRVWVGTYQSGAGIPFTLRVDARGPEEASLQLDAEPTLGTIRIEGVDRHVRDGRTSGDSPAMLARPGCAGHVPTAPHVDLSVQEPGRARIVGRSSDDLVLLVRRPDGSWICDDDSAGSRDPMLVEDLEPGRYRVWVGTYVGGHTADFQLSVEVDEPPPPDPNTPPRLGRWNLDGESLLSFSERVTGRTAVSGTHPECRTLYGSVAPDLELTLTDARTVTLTLTSEEPVGLLVEHPDGTQTCQATVRNQPESWIAGTHRLWVASPEPDAASDFTLAVQTLPR
ncbi:MAG: hypothetical protein H6719_31815 [Sandaracinaceae bacterium]|nr:hypothetical protein [Sandaracinaceae bacterium]